MTSFTSASDFYDKLYRQMNSEFADSTLTWSLDDKSTEIICKFKGCPFRISYSYKTDDEHEMIRLELKKSQTRIHHSISAHLAGVLREPKSTREAKSKTKKVKKTISEDS